MGVTFVSKNEQFDTSTAMGEAKILNDRNAISRYGHEWSPVTVHLVLRNLFYVGDYRYNALREGDRSKPKPESEWIIVNDHHPAIISREQFARVQAILKANKRYRKDMAPASSRERALDRLLNTYIMSDRAISKNEYIRKRTNLETLLSDVNDKLGIAQSEEVQMALTDSEFLTKASQFIIGQKLSNRLYVN